MGNDLRERLEALRAQINEANAHGATVSESVLGMELRNLLDRSYRSGDLVTLSEMEEAVAKAVAEERQAIIKIAEAHLLIDWENKNSLETQGAERMKAAIISAICARSEQKEGE